MSDVDEVFALCQQAEVLFDESPTKALALGLEALRRAKRLNNRELEAWVEFAVGGTMFRLDGRERESLTHLYRSVELAPMTCGTATAWQAIGDVLTFLDERVEALAAYDRSIELFAMPGCPPDPGRAQAETRYRELKASLSL